MRQRLTRVAVALTVTLACTLASSGVAQDGPRKGSPHNKKKIGKGGSSQSRSSEASETGIILMGPRAIRLPDEFRTINGENNNIENPTWGMAEIPFIRIARDCARRSTRTPTRN